jgi:hypothetical protein
MMAVTAVTTAETLAMKTLSGCIRVLCGLPSLHLGALRIGRQMFLCQGGDKVPYGGFGMCGRRRLQVSELQRAQVIRHGGEYEGKVVQ